MNDQAPNSKTHASGGLYILSLSLHGLVRGRDIELGRDADSGGQITYVVEQARALADHPAVERVELLTRSVQGALVDASYSRPRETLSDGAEIVRLPFGPRRYLRKEKLWPHLDELVDRVLAHVRRGQRAPDLVLGHYADAGYVGSQVARILGVPFVFTGHSLGRVKRQRLLERGQTEETIEKNYNITDRIEAEELALETASLVTTSTDQEVQQQYALYDHYEPERMEVIAPGVDLSRFWPPNPEFGRPKIADTLDRFLRDPDKPLILALARPDERKNLSALVRAYGENDWLREHANLVVVAGTRDDIASMGSQPRRVLTELLLLIDRYDLYGKVALPKQHESEDVPDLYRWATMHGGVFVNPALTEPFGLTLIEAAASGLPLVATNDGGPEDIVATCDNGTLVDPLDDRAIGDAIEHLLRDEDRWQACSQNGIDRSRTHYGWERHVAKLVEEARRVLLGARPRSEPTDQPSNRLPNTDRALVIEVDGVLDGDEEALTALKHLLEEKGHAVALGYVTGRQPRAAQTFLEEIGAPAPEFMICSAGTEIVYGPRLMLDRSWARHIDHRWRPREIQHALSGVAALALQPEQEQRRFKLSWFVREEEQLGIRELRRLLRQKQIPAKCILSDDLYLDVVPTRASTGRALRFLGMKWDMAPERTLVVARTGLDADMLTGRTLGAITADHSAELDAVRDKPGVHLVERSRGWAVIDALEHYDFLTRQEFESMPTSPVTREAAEAAEGDQP